jgi:hypothetical protein
MTGLKKQSPMDAVNAREAEWCKATGLRRSRARAPSALRWLPDTWNLPFGFDHSFVYYYKPERVHIILTEPYESVDCALDGLRLFAGLYGGAYSTMRGDKGTGIWYPPYTLPLLIGRPGTERLLEKFAAALPRVPVLLAEDAK